MYVMCVFQLVIYSPQYAPSLLGELEDSFCTVIYHMYVVIKANSIISSSNLVNAVQS
jgi:hypothetical protein